MKKWAAFAVLAVIALAILTACSGGSAIAKQPLDGTSWALFAIRKSTPIAGVTITAEFEESSVRGFAGCNSYQGSYQVDGEQIRFGPIAITEMACMEPEGIMEQETLIMEMMANAERFQLVDGQLQIFAGHEALTFIPQE